MAAADVVALLTECALNMSVLTPVVPKILYQSLLEYQRYSPEVVTFMPTKLAKQSKNFSPQSSLIMKLYAVINLYWCMRVTALHRTPTVQSQMDQGLRGTILFSVRHVLDM